MTKEQIKYFNLLIDRKMTIESKIKELEKYQYQKQPMTDLEIENLKLQSSDFQDSVEIYKSLFEEEVKQIRALDVRYNELLDTIKQIEP
jgi:ASC-1-like (ASCH) protein